MVGQQGEHLVCKKVKVKVKDVTPAEEYRYDAHFILLSQ